MRDGKTTTVHSNMQDDYESFKPERSTVKKQKVEHAVPWYAFCTSAT